MMSDDNWQKSFNAGLYNQPLSHDTDWNAHMQGEATRKWNESVNAKKESPASFSFSPTPAPSSFFTPDISSSTPYAGGAHRGPSPSTPRHHTGIAAPQYEYRYVPPRRKTLGEHVWRLLTAPFRLAWKVVTAPFRWLWALLLWATRTLWVAAVFTVKLALVLIALGVLWAMVSDGAPGARTMVPSSHAGR